MKKRWNDAQFECCCRDEVFVGDICYICECCGRRLCKHCGEYEECKQNAKKK